MIAVIWHSRTGGARAMAHAVAQGGDGEAHLLAAEAATPQDLLAARAYVFVCPENLGTMTGAMKEMFDCSYYPLLGQIEGRAYATAIAAGSDGKGVQAQIDRIVTGWRLRRVAEPVIVNFAAQTPEQIAAPKELSHEGAKACYDLGRAMAEGVKLGIF